MGRSSEGGCGQSVAGSRPATVCRVCVVCVCVRARADCAAVHLRSAEGTSTSALHPAAPGARGEGRAVRSAGEGARGDPPPHHHSCWPMPSISSATTVCGAFPVCSSTVTLRGAFSACLFCLASSARVRGVGLLCFVRGGGLIEASWLAAGSPAWRGRRGPTLPKIEA